MTDDHNPETTPDKRLLFALADLEMCCVAVRDALNADLTPQGQSDAIALLWEYVDDAMHHANDAHAAYTGSVPLPRNATTVWPPLK